MAGGESEHATRHSSQLTLFADFNGLEDDFDKKVDFYQHEQNWTNRMILGDSLLVMTSLAEKEGLKGKVQCIYLDPPYGIKFGSNWQVSTRKRDVKDGKAEDATRQPEQIRAFRDTWKLGIHSYLAYLRDRLVVARELLTDTGSIFVQIGDENVHLVRSVLDEIFGGENFCTQLAFKKTSVSTSGLIPGVVDYLLWFAKNREAVKVRPLWVTKEFLGEGGEQYTFLELSTGDRRRMTPEERDGKAPLPEAAKIFRGDNLTSSHEYGLGKSEFEFDGRTFTPGGRYWSTSPHGLTRLKGARRLIAIGNTLSYVRFLDDFPVFPLTNTWTDTAVSGFAEPRTYVVQTSPLVVQRCIMLSSDPGDLILDPTCGSGTTAFVAEQWGRRWITIDTSRVALALARTRLMAAKYPYYKLVDSGECVVASEGSGSPHATNHSSLPDIRKGFVYKRVPHVTLKNIANNPDIKEGMTREQIDAAIARHAETELLYDKPYEDNKRIRVTGPFTVESLSPHRVISGECLVTSEDTSRHSALATRHSTPDFTTMILDNLRKAGVQNTKKNERLKFDTLDPFAGTWIHAVGTYVASDECRVDSGECGVASEGSGSPHATTHSSHGTTSPPHATKHSPLRRVAISIGPEHGTVGPLQVKEAAKEAVQGVGFDVLIVCGFAFDPHVSEEAKRYGKLTVLPCRMNPDLAMGDELLKKTGAGNLFMVFGEPDVRVTSGEWLVTRTGRAIMALDVFEELSGIGGLEEINRLGRDDLCFFREFPAGGALRADEPASKGGGLGSVQHRRGRPAGGDQGVSPIPGGGPRVAGRSGDAADSGPPTDLASRAAGGVPVENGGRDRENAERTSQIVAIRSLTAADFPLATRHYSQVTLLGVDVYDPTTGQIRSDSTDDIACWFIDTDYNGESFFVRHAYFTGAATDGDGPYDKLKRALRAEIDEAAWSSLYSTVSRPFDPPASGKIAVKVINHYGDEVLKVFEV